MRERPILFSAPMVRALLAGAKTQTRRIVKPRKDPDYGCELSSGEIAGDEHIARLCPYGAPGTRLWVREAHWWFVDEPDPTCGYSPPLLTRDDVEYRADDETKRRAWRPSIHMPRWASRITLEIIEVRVERLTEISVRDCIAEGIPPGGPENPDGIERTEFRRLWESINGPGSWDANPWVWVLVFRRVEAA